METKPTYNTTAALSAINTADIGAILGGIKQMSRTVDKLRTELELMQATIEAQEAQLEVLKTAVDVLTTVLSEKNRNEQAENWKRREQQRMKEFDPLPPLPRSGAPRALTIALALAGLAICAGVGLVGWLAW